MTFEWVILLSIVSVCVTFYLCARIPHENTKRFETCLDNVLRRLTSVEEALVRKNGSGTVCELKVKP